MLVTCSLQIASICYTLVLFTTYKSNINLKTISSQRLVSLPAIIVIFLSTLCASFGMYQVLGVTQTGHRLEPRVVRSPAPINNPTADSYVQPQELPPDYTIPPITNGFAPLLTTIPTKQSVVFLGIDDGQVKLPIDLPIMQHYHIKASLYLANHLIEDNPNYFKKFVTAGSFVENHSVSHIQLSKLSYNQQRKEICDEADLQAQQFGRRPVLFRPPYGDYNRDTQRAAADCGMKAVVLWIAKANGGSMQYQIGDHLRPGDIVLMHFRSEFAQDLQAFADAEKAAGLHTVLLEDWLAK